MTSAIDATKPAVGNAFTADLRANLAAAAAEISALQATLDTVPQGLFSNLSLAFSVSGGALIVAIKTKNGSNPSATDPVRIAFRNASLTTSDYTDVSLTSASSLVISNGSNLGVLNNSFAFRVWLVAFNDAGVIRLGIINCVSDGSHNIYPLGQLPIASSTAEGGVGTANSARTFYTGSAVTSKPYAILGYATYETGLAAVGQWTALPTKIQLFGPQVPLPGHLLQFFRKLTAAVGTGTSIIPLDDTIPQITEGDELTVLNIAFTPHSGANIGITDASINCASSSAASTLALGLFDTHGANALAVTACASPGANRIFSMKLQYSQTIQTTDTVTVSLRIGADIASTTTINGAAGVRQYGGACISHLDLREYMA